MDMEPFTLTYADVRTLMRDLKAIGAHNATRGRAAGLTGKSALEAVDAQLRDAAPRWTGCPRRSRSCTGTRGSRCRA